MFSETKLSVSIFVKSYNSYHVCIEQYLLSFAFPYPNYDQSLIMRDVFHVTWSCS